MRRRLGSRKGRRSVCWPLSIALALPVPLARGAAYLPGQNTPDPPTGDVSASEPAARRTNGNGIRWQFAPWSVGGSLALDGRWLFNDGTLSSRQGLLIGDVDFASYVWQPWFLVVRAGVGFVLARSSTGAGFDGGGASHDTTLNGRVAVSLFPSSRFPFEFRADLTDSRTRGDFTGDDYRTLRLSAHQSYRPLDGHERYRLDVDHSRVMGTRTRDDALSVVQIGMTRQMPRYDLDLDATYSLHERHALDEQTRLTTASARHAFRPSSEVSLDTLATWNHIALESERATRLAGDVRQVSSVVSWQPDVSPIGGSLNVAASARWLQAENGEDAGRQRVRAVNTTLGVSQEFTRAWRATLSGSASEVINEGADGVRSSGVNLTLGWTPEPLALASWRYAPSAQASIGFSDSSQDGGHEVAGLQLSHSVGRDLELTESQRLGIQLGQSWGKLVERHQSRATNLAHSAGLYWQHAGESASQHYAALTLSDSRALEDEGGRFQLVNLQLSQRTRVSRFVGWSADLTMQATRSSTAQIDAFTGELRAMDEGWQRYYSGTLSLDVQRAFGVPRLQYSMLLAANSQQLSSRQNGDIDAPLEHESASMEHRLNYRIGLLEARLTARAARIDDRTVGGIFARVQRRF